MNTTVIPPLLLYLQLCKKDIQTLYLFLEKKVIYYLIIMDVLH